MPLINRPFWFLRHGETDWNRQTLAQGQVEIPLNQTGIGQAHAAAACLQGQNIAAIYTSPLQRAHSTAEIVGTYLGLSVETDPDLIEAAFGDHEGQPMGDWFQHWVDGQYTPNNGESFAALTMRAVTAVNRCVMQPETVLIVAHGGFMRALRGAMALDRGVRTPNAVPLHCRPPGPDGGWSLHSPTA